MSSRKDPQIKPCKANPCARCEALRRGEIAFKEQMEGDWVLVPPIPTASGDGPAPGASKQEAAKANSSEKPEDVIVDGFVVIESPLPLRKPKGPEKK